MSESIPGGEAPLPPTESTPETDDSLVSLDAVAAQNAVPPTPETPPEQIRAVQERVARHTLRGRAAQTNSDAGHAVPVGGASHVDGSSHHGGSVLGKVFSGGYGILGWFFIHVLWQGLSKWHTMAKGGGKSSSPAKSGGDHH